MLVDEFQDTDPVQWEIMRRAFGDGDATLVLIGDPKQAIYAFRGADVYAYLEAAARGRHRARRSTINWRSDQGLIDAYDALFGGAQLGHEGIVYRQRAGRRRQPRRRGCTARRSRRRCASGSSHRDDPSTDRTQRLRAQRRARASTSPRDLAADIVALLSLGREIEVRAEDGERRRERVGPATSPCSCGPTATPRSIRDALDDAGVPAVINGAGSVFAHRAGARLAAAAGGARAPGVDRPARTPRR